MQEQSFLSQFVRTCLILVTGPDTAGPDFISHLHLQYLNSGELKTNALTPFGKQSAPVDLRHLAKAYFFSEELKPSQDTEVLCLEA